MNLVSESAHAGAALKVEAHGTMAFGRCCRAQDIISAGPQENFLWFPGSSSAQHRHASGLHGAYLPIRNYTCTPSWRALQQSGQPDDEGSNMLLRPISLVLCNKLKQLGMGIS